MSHTHPFASDVQKNAYIRDDALILYFDAAETPLVARFDLDSLVQANFEVTKKDESFALVLRDFSGLKQEITTFANKADAHQALYAILQALLSYGENKKGDTVKPNLFLRILKWLFFVLVIGFVTAFALIWFSTPVSRTPAPNAVAEKAAPAVVPDGEPVNMDQFVTAPSAAAQAPTPPASEVQTGVTPDAVSPDPSAAMPMPEMPGMEAPDERQADQKQPATHE